MREAARLRRIIDQAGPDDLRREGIEPESTAEQAFKENLRRRADQTLAAARLLFDLRSASAFVPEIWREWDVLCNMVHDPHALQAHIAGQPWAQPFEQVRRRERFLHWELEFPEVFFDAERPGFDAVLGNPPWDKVKPDKKEFYGRADILIRAFVGGELDRRIAHLHAAHPGLEEEFRAYTERIKTLAACLKKGGDYRFQDWEVDGRSTGGDPDVFKFFVERAWRLAAEGGRVGFVVPSAIYNNEGCTGLRHLLLEEAAVERFYAFENRRKIFPIDSRYKFLSLVFRKGGPEGDGFPAAFMRHDLDELEATARYRSSHEAQGGRTEGPSSHVSRLPPRAPWLVTVRRSELERLSPGTLAFLEYRSPRDREILLKMYGYDAEGKPVNPRPLLGDRGPGTWNARFYREFDMTNDRELWTDPATGKLWNPRQILGPVPGTTGSPPYYDPAAWPDIRAAMAEKGFWPLYEGKHIEQFLVDIKPIERWVSLAAVQQEYGHSPDPGAKVAFRRIASNTNERTCIAALLPQCVCIGDTLTQVYPGLVDPDTAVTVLNALVVDFAVRLRTAGTHLDFTFMLRIPTPELATVARIETVTTLNSPAIGAQSVAQLPGVWQRVWLANRAVAEAYGLGPDDFEYILSTFPVFARKRPEFFAYLLQRLAEWAEEVGDRRVAERCRNASRSEDPRPAERVG